MTIAIYIIFGLVLIWEIVKRLNLLGFSSSLTGQIGEKYVSRLLAQLPESDYTVFNDVLLPVSDNGDTVQIDHIVVSTYGVFVIETKCYSGKIYGSEKKEYWTQYFKYEQHELRNPIIQNQAHVNALKLIFAQYGNIHLIPIVVFAGSAELKITVESEVVCSNDLLSTIRKHSTYFLMPQQREQIIRILELANQTTIESEESHKASVSFKNLQAGYNINKGICPRCGGNLVLRNGRYGEFVGCSNYPKCRFIMDK